MTFKSFFLILVSQLKNKWGRFILASGGIMIGVWTISLTTGISIGLRDTLVQAINSRPEARFLQIYKTNATEFNFTDLNSLPKFQGISKQDIANLKQEHPDIVTTLPSLAGKFAFHDFETSQDFSCLSAYQAINKSASAIPVQSQPTVEMPDTATQTNTITSDVSNPQQLQAEYQSRCFESTLTLNDFEYLYDTNKSNWYGDTNKPTGDTIVICFSCGSLNLGAKLGANKPEDLIGKKITIEAIEAANQYVFENEEYNIIAGTDKPVSLLRPVQKTYTIGAVVDDRTPSLSVGFSPLYLPEEIFMEAIVSANPEAQSKEPLFVEYSLFVNDFTMLKPVTNSINDGDVYLANALVLVLVDGINNLFLGLTVVLSMLGFIAFIASIFGIITVMFISVLERKKEIGILKSLGARDRDIFLQFLLESCALGVVGWIMGIVLATITSFMIQGSVYLTIQNIEALRTGLNVLNITGFVPVFPWWIYPSTLALAVFFTSVSGIVPSFSAARQNPVDVLRSE